MQSINQSINRSIPISCVLGRYQLFAIGTDQMPCHSGHTRLHHRAQGGITPSVVTRATDTTPQTMTAQSSSDEHVYDVVIVGGAIAGLACAVGLLQRGVTNVLVLDKASKMQPVGASIALFSNGIKALEYLSPDVADKVKGSCIPIETMILQDLEGNVLHEKRPPTKKGVQYLVWYLLQKYLAEDLPEGIIKMGTALESFEVGSDGIVTLSTASRQAESESTSTTNTTIRTRVLVGADGIYSRIRQHLFGPTPRHYHEKLAYRAAVSTDLFDAKYVPPRGTNVCVQGTVPGSLFSYRETSQNILTVTSMAKFEGGENSNDGLRIDSIYKLSAQEKKDLMCQAFADYPEAIQGILQAIPPEAVHVDAIRDVDVVQEAARGPVILIGDAAHAMSPSLGQGANQSLEDAAVLVHGLSKLFSPKRGTGDGDGDADEATISKEAINSTLKQVWDQRFERVSMVHAASRARSEDNNKSFKDAPVDMKSAQLMEILAKIDEWDAPVDCL